jgi:hypothetical protein
LLFQGYRLADESETQDEPKPEEKKETPPVASQADLEALRTELTALQQQNARLQGQLEATAARPEAAPEKPKQFDRAELQQMVDAGTISEDKMAEVLERQSHDKLRSEITGDLRHMLSENQAQTRREDEIGKYKARLPGLDTAGHENHERASREYQELLRLGATPGAATECAALRAAFGPAERIKEKTRTEHRGHEETVTSSSGPASPGAESWQKGLSRQRITYAKDCFTKGIWSGPEDPGFKTYLQHARSGNSRGAGVSA